MLKQAIQKLLRLGSIPQGLDNSTYQLAKAYQRARPGSNHHTFCHAPEINMLFSQEGEVYVCCHNQSYPIGKYPGQSISEIWNSAAAEELREKLRGYDLGGGCKICADDFKRGAFKEVRARHFDTLKPHAKYPVMMEFLLSNVCNLECVMCSGKFSSLIRKNREQLPPLHTPYDEAFLKQLDEFIPHLQETRFSGSGEAFSIDMNYVIWEKIIRMNPTCLIMVQTNGTILSGRVKEILERGNFQIGVSIDSLDKTTYESIRVNANFDKVMENVQYFREYANRKGTRFSISMCVMRQNWREVPDFIRLCNNYNAVATLHKVWHPFQNALHNLPRTELEEIYIFLNSQSFIANNALEKQNVSHHQYFVDIVKEWMENAPKVKASVPLFPPLNIEKEENYQKLLTIFIEYIDQNKVKVPGVEGVQVFCKHKLDAFLSSLSKKEEQIAALEMMQSAPTFYVLDILLHQSSDFIKSSFSKFTTPAN
jgi:MoaA/NifB/PqqE/SkfB family radical SAM enzyme